VGGSSGGIMTEALLGVYPDVFMAGVSLMGVPCGCWAAGYNDVTGTGSTAQWSGACAGGTETMTGQQWGDLVRSYFPGYKGHRPRLQHHHGTADTTLNYKNMAEDIKEWTNLLGLAATPTGTDTPTSGTTRQFWKNACGYVVYETFALAGVGHAVPFDGAAVAAYFGLDKQGGQDPETAACPGAVPGGAGMTGGAGGGAAETGSGGAGGRVATGGAAGGQTGTGGGSGGRTASGGQTGSGGNAAGSGGHTPGTGGTTGDGTGGTGAVQGGSGGALNIGTGGNSSSGSGGRGVVAGTGGTPDAAASGGSAPGESSSSSGCSCSLGRDGQGPGAVAFAVLALLAFPRRRRVRGATGARFDARCTPAACPHGRSRRLCRCRSSRSTSTSTTWRKPSSFTAPPSD
jgi:hypothetical protein